MTLQCTFSEPLGNDYRLLWKNEKYFIGGCQIGNCYKGTNSRYDTRITLTSSEQQWVRLTILNVEKSDEGTYECGVDAVGNPTYIYNSFHDVKVLVVPPSSTETAGITLPLSQGITSITQQFPKVTLRTTEDGLIVSSPKAINRLDIVETPKPTFPPASTHGKLTRICQVYKYFIHEFSHV